MYRIRSLIAGLGRRVILAAGGKVHMYANANSIGYKGWVDNVFGGVCAFIKADGSLQFSW